MAVVSFVVAGWYITLGQDAQRKPCDYWQARRGPWERGAHSPATLRELCEGTPLHLTPVRTEDTMSNEYSQFLAARQAQQPAAGFEIDPSDLHSSLSPFQREATALALRRGRAALFEDTGLGKSRQILEWMRQVARHTGGRCLLIVPLAVAHQFVRSEAPAIGAELVYAKNQAEADAHGAQLVVTNYDRAGAFDPSRWAGVALDEADIIANFVGKTTQLLTAMFAATPYRLVATATPAPNDLIAMGRYSQFLGVMDSGEMLTRYFIRDSEKAAFLEEAPKLELRLERELLLPKADHRLQIGVTEAIEVLHHAL